jgi:hypothetical protein
MAFGAAAVAVMLFCYFHEYVTPTCALVGSAAALAAAAYALLQGAWPLGLVQFVWSASALRRWRALRDQKLRSHPAAPLPARLTRPGEALPPRRNILTLECRMARLFGTKR